ncbi:MAG: PAS domain S-box protein [bacterium]|nr:PAS domain S-box protein [bacterium]
MFNYTKSKELRKKAGIKLKEFAKTLDVTESTIHRWETGKRKPSSNDIRIMAYVIGISVSDISDLSELSISNSSGVKSISSISIREEDKNLFKIDKIINEFGDLSSENIENIKNLKFQCTQNQTRISHLEKNIKHYQKILNHNSAIIYVLDSDFRFRYVNDSFILMSGQDSQEKIIGAKGSDLFGLIEIQEILKYEQKVFSEKTAIINRKINIPRSNGKKLGLLNITPQFDKDGNVIEMICDINDITHVSELLNKLQDLRTAIENSDNAVLIKNSQSNKFEYISANIVNITGYEFKEHYTNKDFWHSIIFSDDLKKISKDINRDFNSDTKKKYRYRITKKNGHTAWLETKQFYSNNDNGTHLFQTFIIEDITEEVENSRFLELLKNSLDNANIGIVLEKQNDDRFHYRNRVLEKLTGYSQKYVNKLGMDNYINNILCIDNDKLKYFNNRFSTDVIKNGKQFIYSYKTIHGTKAWLNIHLAVNKFDDETYSLRIHEDVTKHINSENTLELLLQAVDNINGAVSVTDSNFTKYIYLSVGMRKIFGYPLSKFKKDIRFFIDKCLHSDDKEKEEKYINKLLPYPRQRTFRIIKANGKVRKILVYCFMGKDLKLSFLLDVTDD